MQPAAYGGGVEGGGRGSAWHPRHDAGCGVMLAPTAVGWVNMKRDASHGGAGGGANVPASAQGEHRVGATRATEHAVLCVLFFLFI